MPGANGATLCRPGEAFSAMAKAGIKPPWNKGAGKGPIGSSSRAGKGAGKGVGKGAGKGSSASSALEGPA